jgi:hypothetical protein
LLSAVRTNPAHHTPVFYVEEARENFGAHGASDKMQSKANRRRGPGTRAKVRSRRINLEGNTHTQEINVSQLPV